MLGQVVGKKATLPECVVKRAQFWAPGDGLERISASQQRSVQRFREGNSTCWKKNKKRRRGEWIGMGKGKEKRKQRENGKIAK